MSLGVVTLVILPMGKWLLPMGKQLFVSDRFPQGEIASGKFQWISQNDQKKLPMTVPEVSFILLVLSSIYLAKINTRIHIRIVSWQGSPEDNWRTVTH